MCWSVTNIISTIFFNGIHCLKWTSIHPFIHPFYLYKSISLKSRCRFFPTSFPQNSSLLSPSSMTLSARGSSRPWLLSIMAASLLTAAVSCGLALNCAPATVNVYVYQSNAMCLCYMALWTRRLSKTHRLKECGPRWGVYSLLSIWEKWSISWRRKSWTEKLVRFCVWWSRCNVKLEIKTWEVKIKEIFGKYFQLNPAGDCP